MIKKGRLSPSFFNHLKILPKIERTILLPIPRPMVVAVVLSVFSKAFCPADFFFRELEEDFLVFAFAI